MSKLKSETVRPGESRATYPTLIELAKEGRSLFTRLGAAVLATGVGACSGSGLISPNKSDAGSPDRTAIVEPDARTYPDGVPLMGPDVAPDFAPDRAPDLQPDARTYPDGVPFMGPDVAPDLASDLARDLGPDFGRDLGRDAFEVGLPDRPMIIDGGPAIDLGWRRDVLEAAPDRQGVDQTGIDTGAELDAK